MRLGAERIRLALGRRPVPSVQLYEALNGRPVEVELKDLLANPGPLEGRAVRVRGILELLPHGRGLEILDEGAALAVVPQPELDPVVRSLVRDWRGKEVEVAGVLKRSGTAAEGLPSHEVAFWEYLGPEQAEARAERARPATVRDLVERPAEFSGQTIRVVGRFRGANLQRDLDGPHPRSAWVIKSGRAAIWVIGHGPSGPGFALRPDLEQDTTKWVEVVGRLESSGSLNVLRAAAVTLSAPATGTAGLRRLAPAVQPEVTFTLPLVGDEPVEPGSRFLVQFSSYMDEDSFEGRVRLRYAGPASAADELAQARWSYDDVRRTLIVEPGERLRPGATVELLLLPGIADAFATPLAAAGEGVGVPAARVLRWVVQP